MPHGISREELYYSAIRLFRDGCFEEEIEIEDIKIVRRTQWRICVYACVFF